MKKKKNVQITSNQIKSKKKDKTKQNHRIYMDDFFALNILIFTKLLLLSNLRSVHKILYKMN